MGSHNLLPHVGHNETGAEGPAACRFILHPMSEWCTRSRWPGKGMGIGPVTSQDPHGHRHHTSGPDTSRV